MNRFRADLHTHTFLSPCGDIGMVPSFIVETALRKGYDIIGITDHNTTVQAREIRRMVGDGEPYILCGAEITTREEAHCLAFADSEESLDALQRFLDDNLPQVPNDEEMFGYQLAVNADEEVIYEAPYLLISALDKGIDEVAAFVSSIGGLFIPAHLTSSRTRLSRSWASSLRTCSTMPWRFPSAATWCSCWSATATCGSSVRHLSARRMPITPKTTAVPSHISICHAVPSLRSARLFTGRTAGASHFNKPTPV